jgi:hypothetical protein
MGIFLTVKYYNCILLDFSSTPKIILENKDKEDVILLYGGGLCGSCPPGKKLLSMKNRVNILFVVPEEFSEIDLANFKDVFMIKAKVIRGNEEIIGLLKKIASCKRLSEWQNNIYLEIDKGGSISKIKAF